MNNITNYDGKIGLEKIGEEITKNAKCKNGPKNVWAIIDI